MRIDGHRGRLRVKRNKRDFNPMDGMANLADVMLVFACGLLMALIVNWNVDVNTSGNAAAQPQTEKYEIDGIDEDSSQTMSEEADLEEMGTVYKDPKTGKYYVVEGE